MKAELKYITSPDSVSSTGEPCPLQRYTPQDPRSFTLYLEIFIGIRNSDGEERFGLIVSTPSGLEAELSSNEPRLFKCLLVNEWNYARIESFISKIVSTTNGKDWFEIAEKLNREIGGWEFENYRQANI